MSSTRSFKVCLLLMIQLLLAACVPVRDPTQTDRLVDVRELMSYRIEDICASPSLRLDDILVDRRTGEINYLAVEVAPSGFRLDPRTLPLLSREYILVPWRLVRIDPLASRVRLAVDAEAVLEAPHFDALGTALDEHDLEVVERYWMSYSDGK